MSTDSFNPDAYKQGHQTATDLVVELEAARRYMHATTLPMSVGTFANGASMHAQSARMDTTTFTVRDIENGHVLMYKGREFFCDDFTKLAERVVAVMSAAAMDKMNEARPKAEPHDPTYLRMMLDATVLRPESFATLVGRGV